jgi:hypothetical protein
MLHMKRSSVASLVAMNPRFVLPAAAAVLLTGVSVTLHAEDWTAIDGTHYESVVVVKVEADAVTILDRDGGGIVPLSKLPPDLQKRFGYDPAKAASAAAKRSAADRQNEQKLKTEAQVVADRRKKDDAMAKAAHTKAVAHSASADPDYFAGIGHHLGGGSDDARKHYSTSDALSRDPDTSNHGPP